MLIELRGTKVNRRTILFLGLGRFNRGLALIGFRTTGAGFFCRDINFSLPHVSRLPGLRLGLGLSHPNQDGAYSAKIWNLLCLPTGSPSSKYVVDATACAYKELYGKITNRKKNCVNMSFEIKFSYLKSVANLSLVPILKPFWSRLVKLFETVTPLLR